MKAMVMAAGVGSRLRPLTCKTSKPMVPIINKPVMEHVINLLKKYNITEIMVNLHHFPESIREYFGDGNKFGVNIYYSFEEKLLGTAGGVKKVEYFFDDTFLVLSGDGLSDVNLLEAVKFHKSKKSLATLVLKEVDFPLEYGVVIVNDEGRITRFLEKPSWGEVFSNTANTGIYIFEPDIFKEIPYGEEYDFGSVLFPKLLKENKPLYGYLTSDYWCDIGDLPEYRQTHYDILQKKVNITFPDKKIADDIWIGEGTKINPKAKIIGPVIIGKNCTIEEDVEISEYTSIGNNVNICKNTSIKRSIIWDNSYISEHNELRGCIIGKNCFLESGVTIYEGAVAGDNSTIGEKAVIKSDVKIWPDKIIETGVTLSTSLIWQEKWRKNLFGSYGVFGRANIEITPEFAAKLGTAYGTSLGKESSVIISCYNDKMCKMFKRVMEGGLLSSGINIYDAENTPSFLNQFAIRNQGISGGIYINKDIYDSNFISIEFFSSQGLNIDKNLEKKIEKTFYREEFVRALPSEFGKIITCENFEDTYKEKLSKFMDKEKFKTGDFKVVLTYVNGEFPLTKINLTKLIEDTGCKVITLENKEDLTKIVFKEKANLGIKIDTQAESFCIIDEKGKEIDNEQMLILMILLNLKNSQGGNIAVPVNISRKVEELVIKYSRKLFWTKMQERFLMKTCVENDVILAGMGDGRYIFTRYQPVFDPIVSILKLIEFISLEKGGLSSLLKQIPEYYIKKDNISCPWEYKGRILQDIIEEYNDYNLELIDGVKINLSPSEWILILQDTEKPFLHLWVEGNSIDRTNEMILRYKEKILNIIN